MAFINLSTSKGGVPSRDEGQRQPLLQHRSQVYCVFFVCRLLKHSLAFFFYLAVKNLCSKGLPRGVSKKVPNSAPILQKS